MNIETTFDLGDTVFHAFGRIGRVTQRCELCNGAGKVPIVGVDTLISCPKCFGKGENDDGEQFKEWVVSRGPMKVGQVRVFRHAPATASEWGGAARREDEEAYMCEETGVGSGTIYHAVDLFHTREAAELACQERNATNLAAANRYVSVPGVPAPDLGAVANVVADEVLEVIDEFGPSALGSLSDESILHAVRGRLIDKIEGALLQGPT